jgi:hypothetical protein
VQQCSAEPNGWTGEINDYASKEWAGLVGTYYKPRWQIFVAYLYDSITKGTVIDMNKYATDLLLWEQRWNNQTNDFPTQVSRPHITQRTLHYLDPQIT